jgi:hypothetical protein
MMTLGPLGVKDEFLKTIYVIQLIKIQFTGI